MISAPLFTIVSHLFHTIELIYLHNLVVFSNRYWSFFFLTELFVSVQFTYIYRNLFHLVPFWMSFFAAQVDGGSDRACRATTSTDNQPSYYKVEHTTILEAKIPFLSKVSEDLFMEDNLLRHNKRLKFFFWTLKLVKFLVSSAVACLYYMYVHMYVHMYRQIQNIFSCLAWDVPEIAFNMRSWSFQDPFQDSLTYYTLTNNS